MKTIIFIFLINSILSVYYLPKHDSIKVTESTAIVYLYADKFDDNKDIEIDFIIHRGEVNNIIYYDFTDEKPTDSSKPTRKEKGIAKSQSDDEDFTDYSTGYGFRIKKDVSKKYLFFKYSGSLPSIKMDIENPLTKKNIFWICFACAFTAFVIIFLGVCFFLRLREDKKYKDNIDKKDDNSQPNDDMPLTPMTKD